MLRNKKREYEVLREKYDLKDFVKSKNAFIEVGIIKQFPFIPSWAITIDKSQGLTLNKIAVIMEKNNRKNQMYVALSRAKKLEDVIILEREVRKSDIQFSEIMKGFLERIDNKIIHITGNEIINNSITINGNNYGEIMINNFYSKQSA